MTFSLVFGRLKGIKEST